MKSALPNHGLPNCVLPNHSNGVTLNLDELLQYKAQAIRWLPPAKSLWSQLNGHHESAKKGRGMDFSEVRQYQAGDDIRSIDWRVTARTGKTHTKLFAEEREQPVVLYFDLSSSMMFGSTLLLKSVQMAHFASLISWVTTAQKDRIGAIIDTGEHFFEFKPSATNQAPLKFLQKLIELNNTAITQTINKPSVDKQATHKPFINRLAINKHSKNKQQTAADQQNLTNASLSHGLKALHRLCPKGSDIIMMSDFLRLQASDRSLINQIKKHNRIRIVHFFDPLERGQTHFKGSKQVTDGSQTQWLNFSSKTEKMKLEHAFSTKQESLKELCLSLGIPFSSISSALPLLDQITGNKND